MREASVVSSPYWDLWQRQLGDLSPIKFERNAGGRLDLIRRLRLEHVLDGHSGCVNTVCFTPGGELLLSGSDDLQIVVWDWAAGLVRLRYHSGHKNNVFQARAMPHCHDKVIVTCAADGQVRVGNIGEGGHVETRQLATHGSRAHKLALEPGSPHTFLSCGEDGTVCQFDLREAKPRRELLTCFTFPSGSNSWRRSLTQLGLNTVAINPRSPVEFVVGGDDVFARVYDMRRLTALRRNSSPVDTFSPRHLVDHPRMVHITCVAYSEQEELLVSYNDELIYLFEKDKGLGPSPLASGGTRDTDKLAPPEEEDGEASGACQVYQGHRNAKTVKGVNFFGPRSDYVVSGSDCGHIFIWKKQGGELVSMLPGDSEVVNCLEAHPSATILATSGIEHTIKVWSPTAERARCLPPDAETVMRNNSTNQESRAAMISFRPETERIIQLLGLNQWDTPLWVRLVDGTGSWETQDEIEEEEEDDEDREEEEEEDREEEEEEDREDEEEEEEKETDGEDSEGDD